MRDADRAGRHAGQLHDRNARGIGRVRQRAGQTRQQVSEAVGRHRTLDRPEIDGARPAPRHPLDGDAVAERVHRAHDGHQHERRQQGPEFGSEAEIESGPGNGRQADPARLANARRVVESEGKAPGRGARDDADDRSPQAPQAGAAQRGYDDDEQRHAHRDRRRRRRCAVRHIGELAEDDRRQGDRDQHDDSAGHRRGEDPAQRRQPGRQGELEQRRYDDQRGQQPRPALLQCRHGDREKGAAAAHQQDVAGAYAPDPHCLDRSSDPADRQRRAHRPHQIGIAAAGGVDQDRRAQHDAGNSEQRMLHSEPEGQQLGRTLVGLVADVAASVSGVGCHRWGFCRLSRGVITSTADLTAKLRAVGQPPMR